MQFHDKHMKSVLDILSDYVDVQKAYVKSAGSSVSTLSLEVIDLKSEKSKTKYDLCKYFYSNSLTGLLISGIVSMSA